MKHINTRHRLHRATRVLALTFLVATGINSAKANGPTTLTSPPAAQANLVASQHINPAVNEQNRKPTEAKSAPTAETICGTRSKYSGHSAREQFHVDRTSSQLSLQHRRSLRASFWCFPHLHSICKQPSN
jgi:hypothetical protein